MKKWCALMLAVMMLMTAGVSFAEENQGKTIPSTLTCLLENTVSGWYSSANNRALLTVLLLLDISSQDSTLDLDIIKPSYVAKNGIRSLIVFLPTAEENYICVYFDPQENDTITYTDTGFSSAALIEWFIEDRLEMSYEENTESALETVIDELSEVFGI